jgi:hypothetical protein
MAPYLHIRPQARQETDNTVKISAIIESEEGCQKEFWFRLPLEHLPSVTELADPFVTAMIFPAMRSATALRVHGSVSRSLLRNLDEFQAAWSCWQPDRYHAINIIADEEVAENAAASDKAVAAFSGGLDSCFTAWRHTRGDCGRLKRNLKAALMVHGFDIPLHEADVFSRAAENSQAIVKSVGLEFIPMACNFRAFGDDWEDEHGAALASCLSLLSKGFSTGLVAGSHVYDTLLFPWGSNPLTDPMLSSDSFSIVYDSAGISRLQKAKGISEWEEAMRLLRVCWKGKHKDRNCGSCLRCIATALCFAAMRVEPPACLGVPSLDEGVRRLRTLRIKPVAVTRLEEILTTAKEAKVQASWVRALERCLHYKRKQNRRYANQLRQRAIELLRRVLGQDVYYKVKGCVTS